MEGIQNDMFAKAKENFHNKKKEASDWKTFMSNINKANVVLTPWCQEAECEKEVKEKSAIESKLDDSEVNKTRKGTLLKFYYFRRKFK